MPLWLTLGKVSERNIQKGRGGVQIIFTLFRGSTDQFQHFLIVKGWGGGGVSNLLNPKKVRETLTKIPP